MNPNPFNDEEDDNDEEFEPVVTSQQVDAYLKHLQEQAEWADVEWLPGDLK